MIRTRLQLGCYLPKQTNDEISDQVVAHISHATHNAATIYRVHKKKCSLKNRFISAFVKNTSILKTALKKSFNAVFARKSLEVANGWFAVMKINLHV